MFSANATKYSAAVLLGLGISFSIGLPTNAQTPPANGETTAPGPTPGDVKTLFYNKDTFFVPFTANQSFSNGVAASEVLLFVSGDRGASWQLYQRQPPSAKRFAFRAAADGEYWFAVRTNFGAAEPSAEGLDPQLKVVLDTAKPRLELSATFFSATQAGARWGIADPHLDPKSLQLEYRSDPNGIWQPIQPGNVQPIQDGFRGESTWQLLEPASVIEMRAAVKDRSGNLAIVQDEIRFSRPADVPAGSAVALEPQQPIGAAVSSRAEAEGTQEESNADIPWQPEHAPHAVVAHRNLDTGWQSLSRDMRREVGEEGALAESATASTHLANPQTIASGLNPATRAPTMSRSLPAPTQAHMSTSRQFHLDYDVESTDPARIASVSLWATADNGTHWHFYGNDDDRRSPFLVNVDADGLYGFRLLIENSDGIAPQPPRNGDSADVWIHVDSTPPTGRLVAARFGRNAHLGQLQIYWDAEDENLGEQPVTLLYSDQRQGPWRVIADQLANSGRYDWTVKENVPAEFYLQLEIRDRAGNVSRDALRDPISRDGLAPRGVIRDVRPATDSVAPPLAPAEPQPRPTLQAPPPPFSGQTYLSPQDYGDSLWAAPGQSFPRQPQHVAASPGPRMQVQPYPPQSMPLWNFPPQPQPQHIPAHNAAPAVRR